MFNFKFSLVDVAQNSKYLSGNSLSTKSTYYIMCDHRMPGSLSHTSSVNGLKL